MEVRGDVRVAQSVGGCCGSTGTPRGRSPVALLILSRWLVAVGELQHFLNNAHKSLDIVEALRLLHLLHLLHLEHLRLAHVHALRLLLKVLSLGRIRLHVS